ncbi:hypothetical protein [Dyadobacter sp. CY356]|uniref:hypothetical protein n=1 Tax=Dyadobacter sp. CY356 TaxID=2906442 RepID=UPI001F2D32D4|nr:hypothetical protein [Dyadobacter sp. CY356]MCF0055210.1 hypothetical protein [Dyadobacter sp. CY356]
MEIKRTDLPPEATKSDIYKWLLFENDKLSITELTFLALDSSNFKEVRFFQQGYLSFDSDQAIYIRESSSVQNILHTKDCNQLPSELVSAVQHALSDM